jgi:2-alkyl-3-oxoalkanoate reductase
MFKSRCNPPLLIPKALKFMMIVVSGAAGLLGGELVARLIEKGHAVLALIHRTPEIVANDGRLVASTPWEGAMPQAGQAVTLACHIDQPRIGISAEAAKQIAEQCDLILHSAALTAFEAPPADHQAINVDGTAHMLALAPRAGFLQISTAYVCGTKEGVIAERPRDLSFGFSNGYEKSKAAAEALVRAAGAAGREIAIARPSVVLGTHSCGTIRSFDTFYAVFRLLSEGRVSMLPAAEEASIDFVPIDHVIGGIIDIIDHWPRAVAKTFHLTSGQAVAVPDFGAAMAHFEQFSPPQFVAASEFSADALPPRERRLYERAVAQYMGYFARNPRFATDELVALSGRKCPPMDHSALLRMIDYAIGRGFLKSA